MGDLSLGFPLARGIGPVITMVLAIYLLGEHPCGCSDFWYLAGGAGDTAIDGKFLEFPRQKS